MGGVGWGGGLRRVSLRFHASHLHDTIKGGGGSWGWGGVDEGAAAPMRGSVTVVPKPGKWTLAALLAVFLGGGGGGGWY